MLSFKSTEFALIELLESVGRKIVVSPLYCLKKSIKSTHFSVEAACIVHAQNTPPEGCEVAKLALCGEDVKTAAVPPYLSRRNLLAVKSDEVPLTGKRMC